MINDLNMLFADKKIVEKIQNKFPLVFHLAEEETKRDGKIGMEVGSLRERIIVSLLIYYFGDKAVNTKIPTTEPEKDVIVCDRPVSIKTITSSSHNFGYRGVKLSWTVDAQKALEFAESYSPSCDILLVNICWGGAGAFYYIPEAVQSRVLEELTCRFYVNLPKPGTNPRGIEYSAEALKRLCQNKDTKRIIIEWKKPDLQVNVYKRWVDIWEQE